VFVDDCSTDGSRELLDADCFSDALPARYVHGPGMPRQTLIDRDSVA
jgi:hypothetical protein